MPAEKGDIDVTALRRRRPRVAEVPFDADHRFMATFHRWTGDDGRPIVRCFVKGAPDVLAARATHYLGPDGVTALDPQERRHYDEANATLAGQGRRVLAVARKDFPDGFDGDGGSGGDVKELLDRIVLIALVGIVDPPRPEARQAIEQCREAGIRVRMITGDHAVTAAAIARDLGIPGRAVTGAELDLSAGDAGLARRLDDIGVVARVSPEHKLRIVGALQARGDVVAMTGDGVNDAPRAAQGGHRRRHGPDRDGGDQGSGDHGAHRRRLRHHRGSRQGRARHLRQHRQVHPLPGPARRASPSSPGNGSSASC